eukprot:Seg5158.2 transcript_id=Seg5158.2/GoldUCD/mRNA.D3Y31 product="hypothetical protein" protein_id=Seg5158.2/GoldUCD/D3Y31
MDIDLDIVNQLFNFGGKANQIIVKPVCESNEEIISKQRKSTEQKRNQIGNGFPIFKSKRKSAQHEKANEVSSKEDKTSDEMLLLSTFGGMIQCAEEKNEANISAIPPGLDRINTKRRANSVKKTIRFSSKVIILGPDMEKKKGRTKKEARDKSKPLRSILKKKDSLVNCTRKQVGPKKKPSPLGQTAEEFCTIEFHFEANDEESISVINKQNDKKRKKNLTETQEISEKKKCKMSGNEPISEHIDKMINSALEAMTGVQSKEEAANDGGIQDCVTASVIEPLQSTGSEVPASTCNSELEMGQNENSGVQMDDYPVLFPVDSFSDVGGCFDDSCNLAIDCSDQVSAAKTDRSNYIPCDTKNGPQVDSKAPKSQPSNQLSEMRKSDHSVIDSTSFIVPKDSTLKSDLVKEKSFDILATNSESDFESDEEITLGGLIKKLKDDPTNRKSNDEVHIEQEIAEVLANIHAAKEPIDSSTSPIATLGAAEPTKVSLHKENNLPFKSCKEPNQEGNETASLPDKCYVERKPVAEKAVSLQPKADLLNRCHKIATTPQERTVTTIGQLNKKILNMNKSNSRSSRALAASLKSKQPLSSKKEDPKSSSGFSKMDSDGTRTSVANGSISQGKSPNDVNSQFKLGIKLSSKYPGVVDKEVANSLPLAVQEEIRKSFVKMFVNAEGNGNASTLNSAVKTQETSAMKTHERSVTRAHEGSADDITQTVKHGPLSFSSSAISNNRAHQFPTIGNDAEIFHTLDFNNTSPEKARITPVPDLLNDQQKSPNVSSPSCNDPKSLQQYAKADNEPGEFERPHTDMTHDRENHEAYVRINSSLLGEQHDRADQGTLLRDIQRQLSHLQQKVDTLQRNYDAMGGGKQNTNPVQSQLKTHESVKMNPELRQLCQQLVLTQKDVLNLERNAQCTQINAIRGARLDNNGSSGIAMEGRASTSLNGPSKRQNITLRIVVERNGCKPGKCEQKCSK